ncbi:MAG: sulfurtransferase [Nitrospirae bacterium]|nr:MAG: sulfurtransferase [Nitrospirota bacterium]
MKHNPGFLQLVERAKAQIQTCTVDDVKAKLARGETFHLIDIREDHEVQQGRIVSAIHIGRGILERDIETIIPDRHAEIILYCGGGYRSALAAQSLGEMGYSRVRSMEGGFKAWRAAGYPVVQPAS